MDIEVSQCPVCGAPVEIVSYSEEGWGTVETHGYCENCTWTVDQCYSPVCQFILKGFPEKYSDRVKELGLLVIDQNDLF